MTFIFKIVSFISFSFPSQGNKKNIHVELCCVCHYYLEFYTDRVSMTTGTLLTSVRRRGIPEGFWATFI